MLLKEGVLQPMVGALEKDDVNCQRFAALCLANLATTVASQVKVVQELLTAGASVALRDLGASRPPT